MKTLRDKKINIRKNYGDIRDYCFEGEDVKKAILEFEYYLNAKIYIIKKSLKNPSNIDIKEDLEFSLIEYEKNLIKYKEIFGDFEK